MVVLVVEDEAIIAYCSTAELEEAGHVVLGPACSSSEALELARNHPPDVALIDIDLEEPGAGIGLAQRLRAQHDVAIVFTSGQTDLARAHADIAVGVLAKPYDPAELAEIVEYAGSTRRGERRPAPTDTQSFERFDRRSSSRHTSLRSALRRWYPAAAARRDS
jgi:two-component system, response regulator PdtaR